MYVVSFSVISPIWWYNSVNTWLCVLALALYHTFKELHNQWHLSDTDKLSLSLLRHAHICNSVFINHPRPDLRHVLTSHPTPESGTPVSNCVQVPNSKLLSLCKWMHYISKFVHDWLTCQLAMQFLQSPIWFSTSYLQCKWPCGTVASRGVKQECFSCLLVAGLSLKGTLDHKF